MKKVICCAALVSAVLFNAVAASAATIGVKLEKLTSDAVVNVNFDSVTPMNVDDSTLVPLRTYCESAGLDVSWSDSEKTAYIKLNADENSDMPIEQYAFRLLSKADKKGLILTPDSIIATVKTDEDVIRLRYNYRDTDNDIVTLGKNVQSGCAPVVADGNVVVPVRSLMDAFGLWVEWHDNTVIVSIPPFDSPADSLFLMPPVAFPEDYVKVEEPAPVMAPAVVAAASAQAEPEVDMETLQRIFGTVQTQAPKAVAVEQGSPAPEGAQFLGNFKITHYCACSKCCGSYGNATAWAGPIAPGRTIAVDPTVIPKLSTVYIEGYGERRAEDCGGAIKGNKIDVAVSSHSEAMQLGVVYRDVWLVK